MSDLNLIRYQGMLFDLMDNNLRPSSVVGTGYKNAKSVAASWLHARIHNLTNPLDKVSEMFVSSNGKPYSSIAAAERSPQFKRLERGEMTFFASSLVVTSYGVKPVSGGFAVFMVTGKKA
tara:strand:- start:84 stop:443 length:360 start_codon:yes stop_codon:yes gene_type:complete